MGQAFRPTPQEKFLYCGMGVPLVGGNGARAEIDVLRAQLYELDPDRDFSYDHTV
jgi:hypothetical protein